jgi:hypothetical protein
MRVGHLDTLNPVRAERGVTEWARERKCLRPTALSAWLAAVGVTVRLGLSLSRSQRGYGVATFLILLLAGCAASAPALSPADYPFHSVALPPAEYPATYPVPSVEPQVELHWRLTEDSNRVRADGLIERHQEFRIQEVWLQLLGIDATGRIVSFTGPIRFAWRSARALESFSIALKPRGGEQRYDVRLYMFEFAPQLRNTQ